ncbi:MAG: hypothetical protein M1828_000036 [Chrysothrix sp. TS-e1954]|nr:MAG: hypothetical protein M1828_000036 [Chrysothrix sp. TS-e1954]
MLASTTRQHADHIVSPHRNTTSETSHHEVTYEDHPSPPSAHSSHLDSQIPHNTLQDSSSTVGAPQSDYADSATSATAEPLSPTLPPADTQIESAGQIIENRPTSSSASSSAEQPSGTPSATLSHSPSSQSPHKIRVKDLQHIQSFVGDDGRLLGTSHGSSGENQPESENLSPQYEISDMPVTDVIEMVAGLLTKITATNDQQHQHLHQHIPPPDTSSGMSEMTSSVLAFHGKNVPSITILSYLSRIHKYCPATYEVFLSLLVYFDRITERVNSGPLQTLRQSQQDDTQKNTASLAQTLTDHADTKQDGARPTSGSGRSGPGEAATQGVPGLLTPPLSDSDAYNLAHFFVVDSFNIHRLVISGVTCASKFFSDVFFTNSRYAKVGGLPLAELNHLELQFLLLNDFRLSIPVEELEAYATMLVEFYAREVVSQRHDEGMQGVEMDHGSSINSEITQG